MKRIVLIVLLLLLAKPANAVDVAAIRAQANAGNVAAMVTMGSLYFRGYLVQQDGALALQWYLMAASQARQSASIIRYHWQVAQIGNMAGMIVLLTVLKNIEGLKRKRNTNKPPCILVAMAFGP